MVWLQQTPEHLFSSRPVIGPFTGFTLHQATFCALGWKEFWRWRNECRSYAVALRNVISSWYMTWLLVGRVLRMLDRKVWIVKVLFQSVATPSPWKKLFCREPACYPLSLHRIAYQALKRYPWNGSELCRHLSFKGFSLIMGIKRRTSAHFKQVDSRVRKHLTRFLAFVSNRRSVHLDTMPLAKKWIRYGQKAPCSLKLTWTELMSELQNTMPKRSGDDCFRVVCCEGIGLRSNQSVDIISLAWHYPY